MSDEYFSAEHMVVYCLLNYYSTFLAPALQAARQRKYYHANPYIAVNYIGSVYSTILDRSPSDSVLTLHFESSGRMGRSYHHSEYRVW